MDISKEYIEMCVAAKELQKQWKCKGGDFYQLASQTGVAGISTLINQCMPFKESIWLPRQDQLQEMLSKEYVTVYAMLQHFYEWYIENDDYLEELLAGNESMEQLWLIFVMKEEFGKMWTGKSWYGFGKI